MTTYIMQTYSIIIHKCIQYTFLVLSVNSKYSNNGGSVLSPAAIGGIIGGAVVLIALLLSVTVVVVLVGRMYYRRKPKQRYSITLSRTLNCLLIFIGHFQLTSRHWIIF